MARATKSTGDAHREGASDVHPMKCAIASIPRQEVEGSREGVLASLECLGVRGLLTFASRLPHSVLMPTLSAFARIAKSLDKRHSNAARPGVETRASNPPQRPRRPPPHSCPTRLHPSCYADLDAKPR